MRLLKYTKLTPEALAKLCDRKWKILDNTLTKKYALPSHTAAGDFAFQLAKVSDKLNHHPQLLVKYRFVTVYLKTNDIDDLSDYDERLATLADELKPMVSAKYTKG